VGSLSKPDPEHAADFQSRDSTCSKQRLDLFVGLRPYLHSANPTFNADAVAQHSVA